MTTVPILMYHSIGGSTDALGRFAVDTRTFTSHIAYLASAGYRTITVAELGEALRRGNRPSPDTVVLTFDDGFHDFHTTAFPVLSAYGFTATIYVPSGYVGSTGRWLGAGAQVPIMDWEVLRHLAGAGIEIAAHSHSHPQLDRLPQTQVRDEVRRCRATLEDELGIEVRGFAYPYGYWNATARRAVADAGYTTACAVGELASRTRDDLMTLPRLTVDAGTTVGTLRRLLRSRPSPTARCWSAAKRHAWRAGRRYVPNVSR